MELSIKLDNEVVAQYEEELAVCSLNLRNNLLLLQRLTILIIILAQQLLKDRFFKQESRFFSMLTKVKKGTVRERSDFSLESSKLKRLPSVYANVRPITSYNNKPEYSIFNNLKLKEMSIEEQVSVENK